MSSPTQPPSGPKPPVFSSVADGIQEIIRTKKITTQKEIASLELLTDAAVGIPYKSKRSQYLRLGLAAGVAAILASTCGYFVGKSQEVECPEVVVADAGPVQTYDAGPVVKAPKAPPKAPKTPPKAPKVAKAPVKEEEDFTFEVPGEVTPVKISSYDIDVKGCPSSFEKYMNTNAMPEILAYFNNQLENDRMLLNPKQRLQISFSLDQGVIDDQKSIEMYKGNENLPLPGDKLKTYTKFREYTARTIKEKANGYFKGEWTCKPSFTVQIKR